jgi:hypothetical protein
MRRRKSAAGCPSSVVTLPVMKWGSLIASRVCARTVSAMGNRNRIESLPDSLLAGEYRTEVRPSHWAELEIVLCCLSGSSQPAASR